MNLLFLDTETTGFTHNRLVQLAWEHHPSGIRFVKNFKPPVPIEEGATKVHGKTNEMTKDWEPFKNSKLSKTLALQKDQSIVVCHNAEYDLRVLLNEGVTVHKYICTMKVARKLLPHQIDHKLQGLYQRIMFTIPDEEIKAHDALGDVLVMVGLFAYMFAKEKDKGLTDDQVIDYFGSITLGIPDAMPFGKYKGVPFKDLPEEYVKWMVTKSDWSKDILVALYQAFPQYKS